MVRLKNPFLIICLVTVATFMAVFPVGCHKTPSPVDIISIFKASPDKMPPKSFGMPGTPIDPYPTHVQQVFISGDTMFLGLGINNQPKTDVTFSKYTSYSKTIGKETEIGLPTDLGPFEAHSLVLVAFENPWPVPDEPGIYEVRVYLGNEIVASAVFEVKIP
ncbi:MAG TPA: hypothetical protein VGA85_04485 [Dehalococcoidales bacterium]